MTNANPAPTAPTTTAAAPVTPAGIDIALPAPPELFAPLAAAPDADVCETELDIEPEPEPDVPAEADADGCAELDAAPPDPVELPTRPTPYDLVEAPSSAHFRPPMTCPMNVSFCHATDQPQPAGAGRETYSS